MTTIRELIEKLRAHDYSMPVAIGTKYIVDKSIEVKFDSEWGVLLSSPSIDEFFGDLVDAATKILTVNMSVSTIEALRTALFNIGVEIDYKDMNFAVKS